MEEKVGRKEANDHAAFKETEKHRSGGGKSSTSNGTSSVFRRLDNTVALIWLQHMKASCEPPTFSFEKLLLGISRELRENLEACRWTLPLLENMCEKEQRYRTQLVEMGLKTFERLPLEEAADPKKAKRPRLRPEDSNHECDFCRISCHVSMVVGLQDDTLYCLEHAVHCLQRKNMKGWKLLYTYDMDELRSILRKLKEHIESEEASQIKTDSDSSTPKKKVVKKKGV